jgi:peptidoglycan/xylan/chitin deacetylase (PgdA/CDA1 family)
MFHKSLAKLDDASLNSEVENSRVELERLTGAPVKLIAARYGDVDERVRRAREQAGYDALFTTAAENVDPADVKMLRGRIRVDPWDGPIEFLLKFSGAYAWLPKIPRLFRAGRPRR